MIITLLFLLLMAGLVEVTEESLATNATFTSSISTSPIYRIDSVTFADGIICDALYDSEANPYYVSLEGATNAWENLHPPFMLQRKHFRFASNNDCRVFGASPMTDSSSMGIAMWCTAIVGGLIFDCIIYKKSKDEDTNHRQLGSGGVRRHPRRDSIYPHIVPITSNKHPAPSVPPSAYLTPSAHLARFAAEGAIQKNEKCPILFTPLLYLFLSVATSLVVLRVAFTCVLCVVKVPLGGQK